MSTKIIELEDRIITDKGDMVAKHALLVKKALSGEVFTDYLAIENDDIKKYNYRAPDSPIETWVDDGEIAGPDDSTYNWTIPKEFQKINIEEVVIQKATDMGLTNEEYVDRLIFELNRMEELDMFPFIRCLLYITGKFREKNIVWGVGRGSSCASLVLFVLGVNKVDPVKYNIDPKEFFK